MLNITIYRFFPHGSKNIDDLTLIKDYSPFESFTNIEMFCHDQEPLNFDLYKDTVAKVSDEFQHLVDPQCSSLPKQNLNKKNSNAAEERQLRKDLARIERQMEKLDNEILQLHKNQSDAAYDAEKLIEATDELESANQKRAILEEEWLKITLALEE